MSDFRDTTNLCANTKTIINFRRNKMAENLKSVIGTAAEKIREMMDANTVIGNSITTPDGSIIIPVSRINFGFASGGTDTASKITNGVAFAGGAGAGLTIKPVAFVVVRPDGDIRLLEIAKESGVIDGVISSLPDLISKLKAIFGKKDEPKSDDSAV
jgi:sporulation protein YtfJ